MSATPPYNSEDLFSFLETTLSALDNAAGDVDQEARQKLDLLKETVQQGTRPASLLSEASIDRELARLDASLSQMEEKISQVDPLTKNLLGLSAHILTKAPETDNDPSSKI